MREGEGKEFDKCCAEDEPLVWTLYTSQESSSGVAVFVFSIFKKCCSYLLCLFKISCISIDF